MGVVVSYFFFFFYDTLIFYDLNEEHLEFLSWAFMWLEAIFGLKIN